MAQSAPDVDGWVLSSSAVRRALSYRRHLAAVCASNHDSCRGDAGSFRGTTVVAGTKEPSSPVPENNFIAPHAGTMLDRLDDVTKIVNNAVTTANQTRAVIRLPAGQRARMVIAVTDLDGSLLALNRMPDATIFSIDVAVSKARNMMYFNSCP